MTLFARQRTMAVVGVAGAVHNAAEPAACEGCGRETCARRFDGVRWVVTCSHCILRRRDEEGMP